MRIRTTALRGLLAALAIAAVTRPAAAQSASWNLNGSGSYGTAANWLPMTPPVAGGTATFALPITAASTVSLNVNATLDGLAFTNVGSNLAYTLSAAGANTLTFNSGATLTFAATVPNTLSAPVTLNGPLTVTGRTFNNQAVSGVLTGGSLVVNTSPVHVDAGSVQLGSVAGGANTLTEVRLQAGVLRALSPTALGGAAGLLRAEGGVLQPAGAGAGPILTPINLDVAGLTITSTGASSTLGGAISGTNGLTVSQRTASTVTLTAANTYDGPTAVRLIAVDTSNAPSNAGTLLLSGAGTALNSSRVDVSAGIVRLSSGGQANAVSRIGAVPVNLNNGVFEVVGGTSTTTSFTQPAGLLTGTGYNVVAASSAAATQEGVEVAFTGLSRGAAGTGTFLFIGSGASFGTAAPAAGVQRITFATAPPTAGGPLGGPTAAVLPFAVGVQSTGNVTGLATYDANGVRLLDTGTEYSTDVFAPGANYRQTATQTNAAAVAVNSVLTTAGDLLGTGTLTVGSGVVAFANAPTVTNNLAFGTQQANVFTLGGSAVITGRVSGGGGLVKSGGSGNSISNGTNALTLSAYNTYTGTTAVNDGFVQFTDPSALGRSTSAVLLNSRAGTTGSGLRVDPAAAGAGVVVNFARPVVTSTGYSNLSGATGAANARAIFLAAGDISGDGGVMAAGFSPLLTRSLTILSGTNTHARGTRLGSGDLGVATDANLGAAAAPFDLGALPGAGLIQFGNLTTGRVINVSSGSQWDTNGFDATLSGALTGTPATFTKAGNGLLTLTDLGPTSFAPAALNVAGGGLTLSGTTALPNLSGAAVNILSGTLRFDNTATLVNNRLGAQSGVRFQTAGTGTFRIDAGTNAVTQTFTNTAASAGGIVVGPGGAGSGRIVLTASGAGSVVITVNSATAALPGYTPNSTGSMVVAGDGLNNTFNATTPGQTALRFTNPPTETTGALAGTGAAGAPTVGILRGGIGIRTGAGAAIGLLTQTDIAAGVRLLDVANEYAVNPTILAATNANVRITAPHAFVDTVSVNSLSLLGSTLTLAAANTSTVRSGTVLATGGGAFALTGSRPGGGGAILRSNAIGPVGGEFNSGFVYYVDAATILTTNVVYAAETASTGGAMPMETVNARIVKVGPGRLVFDPRNAAGVATPANPAGSNLLDTRVFDGTFALPSTFDNIAGNLLLAGGAGTVFEYRGPGVATGRTIGLNGAGGTLDLAGTSVQLNSTANSLISTAGAGGELRLAAGTLVLGSGTATTPAAVQPNSLEGGVFLNGGMLALNADSSFATSSVLGTGTLRLGGGMLAPRFATRSVVVPVEVVAGVNPTFVNNTTPPGLAADTSNSGLTFLAPVRLESAAVTLTNGMASGGTPAGGLLTFAGSIYDNPFKPAAAVSFSAGAGAGQIVLAGPAVYRGGTTVLGGAVVRAANTVGSATGPGNLTVLAGGELRGGNTPGTAGFVVPAPGGTVTVNGTLAPGNGLTQPGILTVGAPDRTVNLALAGGTSRYTFNLAASNLGSGTALNDGSSTTAAGAGNNFLRVLGDGTGGSLAFAPATFAVVADVGLANFNSNQFYSYQVASLADGAVLTIAAPTFDVSQFGPATDDGTFSLSQVGQNVYLNFTPVPEPATLLLVAGLGLGAARLRRRLVG